MLGVGERHAVDPLAQIPHRQRRHLRDVAAINAYLERVRLQLGPATVGARLGALVLAQENTDVLFVALVLEGLEKGIDARVAAGLRAQQLRARRLRELTPRRIGRRAE